MKEKKVLHGEKKAKKNKLAESGEAVANSSESGARSSSKRGSAYKNQLAEKQKIKEIYGVREAQFKRFFDTASRTRAGLTGENLLCLLERRLDNVLYRLKLSGSRKQARQAIVHGNVLVNGSRVSSPSFLVKIGDTVSYSESILKSQAYVQNCIEKRLEMGIRVPDWLELRKDIRTGVVSRMPKRADIPAQFEEHLIVELYSKS